jgi:hypothetical protein
LWRLTLEVVNPFSFLFFFRFSLILVDKNYGSYHLLSEGSFVLGWVHCEE